MCAIAKSNLRPRSKITDIDANVSYLIIMSTALAIARYRERRRSVCGSICVDLVIVLVARTEDDAKSPLSSRNLYQIFGLSPPIPNTTNAQQ